MTGKGIRCNVCKLTCNHEYSWLICHTNFKQTRETRTE